MRWQLVTLLSYVNYESPLYTSLVEWTGISCLNVNGIVSVTSNEGESLVYTEVLLVVQTLSIKGIHTFKELTFHYKYLYKNSSNEFRNYSSGLNVPSYLV